MHVGRTKILGCLIFLFFQSLGAASAQLFLPGSLEADHLIRIVRLIQGNFATPEYIFVGVGRSPGPVTTALELIDPVSTANVPLTAFRFSQEPTAGAVALTAADLNALHEHLRRFLPLDRLQGRKILLIDFTSGEGDTLRAAQEYISEFVRTQSLNVSVETLAIRVVFIGATRAAPPLHQVRAVRPGAYEVAMRVSGMTTGLLDGVHEEVYEVFGPSVRANIEQIRASSVATGPSPGFALMRRQIARLLLADQSVYGARRSVIDRLEQIERLEVSLALADALALIAHVWMRPIFFERGSRLRSVTDTILSSLSEADRLEAIRQIGLIRDRTRYRQGAQIPANSNLALRISSWSWSAIETYFITNAGQQARTDLEINLAVSLLDRDILRSYIARGSGLTVEDRHTMALDLAFYLFFYGERIHPLLRDVVGPMLTNLADESPTIAFAARAVERRRNPIGSASTVECAGDLIFLKTGKSRFGIL